MSSIDPSSMATQLATAYTQDLRSLLGAQSTKAQSVSSALSTLRSALSAFDSALLGLSAKKSAVAHSATFSTTGYATATASGTAQAGTYSLFVEQVASASQIAYDLSGATVTIPAGTLTVGSSGASFSVTLGSAADTDSDGSLSASEIARAINNETGNNGLVNASVATANGTTQLILTAGNTGANSTITLGTGGLTNGSLSAALSAATTLATGQDAKVWLGPQASGVLMQQASNTFTNINGVSMTFSKAQAIGDTPLTLAVENDGSGTAANLQTFIDAYNTLTTALDKLTASANTSAGTAAGAFASDSGVRALRSRLASIVRQQSGAVSLATYGISLNREGKMSLDQSKMKTALTNNPGGLDTLLGSTSGTTGSGILGALDTYTKNWTNSATGQIAKRQNSIQTLQKSIDTRQTRLDDMYNSSYRRYLKQFSALQQLQSQLNDTSNMFSGLTSS